MLLTFVGEASPVTGNHAVTAEFLMTPAGLVITVKKITSQRKNNVQKSGPENKRY
jgi:hypothetical protein